MAGEYRDTCTVVVESTTRTHRVLKEFALHRFRARSLNTFLVRIPIPGHRELIASSPPLTRAAPRVVARASISPLLLQAHTLQNDRKLDVQSQQFFGR